MMTEEEILGFGAAWPQRRHPPCLRARLLRAHATADRPPPPLLIVSSALLPQTALRCINARRQRGILPPP